MTAPKRILIVEGDLRVAEAMRTHLQDGGYGVEHAADGHAGTEALARCPWDAVVLDAMSRGVDGLQLCRHVRAMARYTPIVMTSARSSEVDRILGLELGADDYLTWPYSMRELVARLRALLRRADALARDARLDAGSLEFDGLRIDPLGREVRLHGSAIELRPREFELLHFLARHAGTVYSRLELLNQVWGYRHDGYEHTVNTHVNRLRAKVEPDPARPRWIVTVWGRGYAFAEASASRQERRQVVTAN